MTKNAKINELAHVIANAMGWLVPPDLEFNFGSNPRAHEFWAVATKIYEHQARKARPRSWIAVTKRLPEIPDGEHRSECVLVWADDRVEQAFFYDDSRWWLDDSDYDIRVEPTHWRPMLEPPPKTD